MSRDDTRAWPSGWLILLAVTLVGCGAPPTSVCGTVRFKGQPLPSGTVLFHGADGRVEYGLIAEGGKYALANAVPGPARISVRSHAAAPVGMPGAGKPPAAPAQLAPTTHEKRDGKFVSIPPRYLDPNKSGLTYTVRPGAQTHDINLQP